MVLSVTNKKTEARGIDQRFILTLERDSAMVVSQWTSLQKPPAGKMPRKPKEFRAKARVKPAVKVFRDGREVCNDHSAAGKLEYARRRAEMWERDHGICCICHKFCPLDIATTEHPQGRGMGGGHRDDRVETCGIAHPLCNSNKGSRRQL